MFLLASVPATAPSYTTFATWSIPGVLSPHAYKLGRFVCILSLTTSLLFLTSAPNFKAKSTLLAVPRATNKPDTSNTSLSSKTIFSSDPSPTYLVIFLLSILNELSSNKTSSPFVKITTSLAKCFNSFASFKAYALFTKTATFFLR